MARHGEHRHDPDEDSRGHGFDLAAAAAQGPLLGSDQTNGVVDVTEDRVDDVDTTVDDAIRRSGQANIAGLGGF